MGCPVASLRIWDGITPLDLYYKPHKCSTTGCLPFSRQFIQQHLGLFEVRRVKPFGEPAVDLCQHLSCFFLLTPLPPQSAQTHCRFAFFLYSSRDIPAPTPERAGKGQILQYNIPTDSAPRLAPARRFLWCCANARLDSILLDPIPPPNSEHSLVPQVVTSSHQSCNVSFR